MTNQSAIMPLHERPVSQAARASMNSPSKAQDKAHFSMKILATRLVLILLINYMTLASICCLAEASTVRLSGWTEVKNGWPLEAKNYFIATKVGHHFIKFKNLPNKPSTGFQVRFEYYYSYDKMQPLLQMTACNESIDFNTEAARLAHKQNPIRHWLEHTIQVNRTSCEARNEIAYNVLLHDEGDIFAWKSMSVEDWIDRDEKNDPDASDTSSDPNEAGESSTERPEEDEFSSSNPEEQPTEESSTSEPVANGQESDSVSLGDKESNGGGSTASPVSGEKLDASSSDEAKRNDTTDTPKPNITNTTSAAKVQNDYLKFPRQEDTQPISVSQEIDGKLFGQGDDQNPFGVQVNNKADKRDMKPKQIRIKRMAGTESSGINDPAKSSSQALHNFTCQPSSCDLSMFDMRRFTPLVNGLPSGTNYSATQRRTYIGFNENKPLRVEVQLEDQLVSAVDTCFDFQLYMDMDTELQLLLEEKRLDAASDELDRSASRANATVPRLLERIERKPGQSGAGRFERFERCLSDYMPAYKAGINEDTLTFLFELKKLEPSRLVALMAEPSNRSLRTQSLYPVQSYAPDVRRMQTEAEFNNYWTVDRDGIVKAQVKLEQVDTASSSRAPPPELRKRLLIGDIDPTQEYFDLTSRWMQVKNVQLIEQPILFDYKADEVDWADRVEFQFQRAGDPFDKWITHEAKPSVTSSNVTSAGNEPAAKSETNTSLASMIELPLKLKGLDSEHFRIRVRHHLAQSSGLPLEPKKLRVNSLSFADACAYNRVRAYCRNAGICRSTGPATADCDCKQGFSGSFCELVRPCEVLYMDNSLDGHSLCKNLGATCVENLPVLRCAWPNDKYYKCDALYQPGSQNSTEPIWMKAPEVEQGDNGPKPDDEDSPGRVPSGGTNPEPPSSALPPEQQMAALKETVSKQAKLVIILGVFLLAIVIFALVLIASMIGRLRESKSRLQRSQNEVHELARRFSPSTSGGVGAFAASRASQPSKLRSGSNGSKIGTTSYNNAAFDVE